MQFVLLQLIRTYISCCYMSQYCPGKVYFRQGTGSSNDGITYHDMKSLANHLGEAACKIMPAFDALTGWDYTTPYFVRSKYSIFTNTQNYSNTERLLLRLNTERVEVSVIDFIIHIVYNRPKPEKTAAQCRYGIAIKTSKIRKKKFNDTKRILPDESTLKMKIMRANFVRLGIC